MEGSATTGTLAVPRQALLGRLGRAMVQHAAEEPPQDDPGDHHHDGDERGDHTDADASAAALAAVAALPGHALPGAGRRQRVVGLPGRRRCPRVSRRGTSRRAQPVHRRIPRDLVLRRLPMAVR